MTIASFLSWLLWESLKSAGALVALAIALLVAVVLAVLIAAATLPSLGAVWSHGGAVDEDKSEFRNGDVVLPDYIDPRASDPNYLGQRLHLPPEGVSRWEVGDWVMTKMAAAGCLRYAWLEIMWILDPPVGPAMKAAWAGPPVALETGGAFIVYVVEIDACMSDGSVVSVYKPGMTGRSRVVGSYGRFSESDGVKRVITECGGLTARRAWQVEQKLLSLMPKPPWTLSFEEEVAQRTGEGAVRETVRPLLSKSDRSRLGPTEWRSWLWSEEELKETLETIVSLTPHLPDAEDG